MTVVVIKIRKISPQKDEVSLIKTTKIGIGVCEDVGDVLVRVRGEEKIGLGTVFGSLSCSWGVSICMQVYWGIG